MQLRGESVGLEGGAGKYNGIQCLRLVAAFIVILMHSTFYLKERLVPEYPIWLNGARGVDIFFTISGFVMFVSSKRLSGISGIKTFCEKRAIRILPLYWFVTTLKLAIMIVVPGVALHSSIEAVYVLKSYLLIPSENVEGNVEPLLGVGWTLILEFFFYGVFAIGLLARRKILEFCSIVLLAFFAISFFRSSNWPAYRIYFDARVLEFLLGMIIAQFLERHAVPSVISVLAVFVGAAYVVFGRGLDNVFLNSLAVPLAAAALVFGVASSEGRWGSLFPRWMIYMGAVSYALYLIHPIVAPVAPVILRKLSIVSPLLSITLSVTISIIASILLYELVDRPVGSFLNRLIKGNQTH